MTPYIGAVVWRHGAPKVSTEMRTKGLGFNAFSQWRTDKQVIFMTSVVCSGGVYLTRISNCFVQMKMWNV